MTGKSDSALSVQWKNFVSNEQVLRRGVAISSSISFTRGNAIKLARDLEANISDLDKALGAVVANVGGVDFRQTAVLAVHENQKIIVGLPSYGFSVNGRSFELGLSCTVCQGETSSKIWVKLTRYQDKAEFVDELASKLLDAAFDFYTNRAKTIETDTKFKRNFTFNIVGAYSTDYAIPDVVSVLSSRASSDEKFKRLREDRKLFPLRRLFDFAAVDADAFALPEDALATQWQRLNHRDKDVSSAIVPVAVKQSEGVVFMRADRKKSELYAWGLCHIDSLDWNATPPVYESASQLTGKLASLLAADV